jgi:hypothetical protein
VCLSFAAAALASAPAEHQLANAPQALVEAEMVVPEIVEPEMLEVEAEADVARGRRRGGFIKRSVRAVGNGAKKVGKAIGSGIKKTGKAIGKAAKATGHFGKKLLKAAANVGAFVAQKGSVCCAS